METKNTKSALLNAFDESEKKTVSDVCRIVGINPTSFYFHFNRDSKFRQSVLEKRREVITARIEANI